MGLDLTMQFVATFWGMVALMLVLCGALLACVDPATTTIARAHPAPRRRGARALLATGVAVLIVGAGIAAGFGALFGR